MIPSWNKRPTIVANILNPAFCGEVLRVTVKSYEHEKKAPIPFPLLFIILPILLHKDIRNSLPKTTTSKFYDWLEENEKTKLFLPSKIKNVVPYTREAISFLIYHEAINFDSQGNISVKRYRKKNLTYTNTSDVKDIFNKGKILGKWLTRAGDVKTIYTLLGIKP